MDSQSFLERISRAEPRPVYVLHGDEDFLKRQVLEALREHVLGPEGQAFGLSVYEGDKADFAVIRGDLETLPFLSPRRVVVIESADEFVSENRAALEKYVAQPAATGLLVLVVDSWPSTTKLARALEGPSTVVCKAFSEKRLPEWCIQRAAVAHGKQLAAAAAQMLVDLVGKDLGQLDQELAKLAVYVGDGSRIDSTAVDQLVGHSRAENMWKIFDAIGGGRTGDALALLDRLFGQGEDPMRILAGFSMRLRQLAQAYRLNQQGVPLSAALERAGIPSFGVKAGEQQLRHLGRRRGERLYDWLLETDLSLKGTGPQSQLPPRTVIERLVVQLARPLPRPDARSGG
jgi:DNA polymerase-3 subunit delta